MNQALQVAQNQDVGAAIEKVMIGGDLSVLNPEQRVKYYNAVCTSVGLNPLTKPFDYITLNGKLVLYANKGCTEQLRANRKISVKITAKETIEGVYVVTVEGSEPNGRVDSATGAVPIQGLKGEALANAFLKCETKAKRRLTLSICSLNMLDETEVETIVQKPGTIIPSQMQPPETDGVVIDKGYRIPFGKFAKRALEEVDPKELESYVEYLEKSAHKKGIELQGQVLDFVDRAVAYIVALDKGIDGEDAPF